MELVSYFVLDYFPQRTSKEGKKLNEIKWKKIKMRKRKERKAQRIIERK
jgi:hypothetical protein